MYARIGIFTKNVCIWKRLFLIELFLEEAHCNAYISLWLSERPKICTLICRNLPCPQKFLVTRLPPELLFSSSFQFKHLIFENGIPFHWIFLTFWMDSAHGVLNHASAIYHSHKKWKDIPFLVTMDIRKLAD